MAHCRVLQKVCTVSFSFRQAVPLSGGFAASVNGAGNIAPRGCHAPQIKGLTSDGQLHHRSTLPSPLHLLNPISPYLTLYLIWLASPSSHLCSSGPLLLWPSRRRRSHRITASVMSRRRVSARRSLRDKTSSTASPTGRTLSVRHSSPNNDRAQPLCRPRRGRPELHLPPGPIHVSAKLPSILHGHP
jgi:hypothetical protein